MPNKDGTGPRGRGIGRRGQGAIGVGGYCVCFDCNHKEKHTTGQPCNKLKCPKCNNYMTREE